MTLWHVKDGRITVPFTLDQYRKESVTWQAKYGKILPEPVDPDDRGPSSISEATEDKNETLIKLMKPVHIFKKTQWGILLPKFKINLSY